MSSDTVDDLINKRVGHYQILRLIGRGGFSHVYLGQHIHLETPAAVKILKPPLVPRWRRQFMREARIAASLHHPHILPVLDFGIWKGAPYLVMPLAHHGSLRVQYQHGEAPGFGTMLHYLEQIASALEYLHRRGLLHLDLKPENLLLDDDWHVLLSDFGIAEMSRQHYTRGVGTPAYMAPEQIEGRASAASDQYALAIVVYEWLAGRKPFRGTREEILAQQLHTRPDPICEQAVDVTSEMERVVFRALAKDPARRYSTVQAFVQALSQATLPALPGLAVDAPDMTRGKALTTRQYLLKIETWEETSRYLVTWINIATVLGFLVYFLSKSMTAAFYTFGFLMPLLPLRSLFHNRNVLAQSIVYSAFLISIAPSYLLHSVVAFPLLQGSILTVCIIIVKARKYIARLWANPEVIRRLKMWFDRFTRFIL